MKIVPFPGAGSASPEEAWLAELEAALNGGGRGASADSWRELRADVRALAPPMDPEFERQLRARIVERGARSVPKQASRRVGWLHPPSRPMFAAISVAFIVIAAVLIAAPWRPADHTVESSAKSSPTTARADRLGPALGPAESASTAGASAGKASLSGTGASGSASAGAASNTPVHAPASAPATAGTGSAPARVQQLAASITLSATASDVQETADRVSRLAVSNGGFVQSSHVNVGQGTGEANLMLSLPSAKLSDALASLGQLAPVRAESQSLQDITNIYNAAAQRLADATAERRALLRALARASTEGQIDSLRERLSAVRGAVARARSALQTLSQHASTAEVEVTVLGDTHGASEGLTLHRGLHDAGRVLVVTLVALLIAAAVLVPLALLLTALLTARRAWRRYQRERALDSP